MVGSSCPGGLPLATGSPLTTRLLSSAWGSPWWPPALRGQASLPALPSSCSPRCPPSSSPARCVWQRRGALALHVPTPLRIRTGEDALGASPTQGEGQRGLLNSVKVGRGASRGASGRAWPTVFSPNVLPHCTAPSQEDTSTDQQQLGLN